MLLLCYARLQLKVAKVTAAQREELGSRSYRRASWEATQRYLSEEVAQWRSSSTKKSSSLVHLSIHPFSRSLVDSMISSFTHCLTNSLFIDSLIHCFIGSLIHCFIDSLIHWLIGSSIISLVDSLSHCFIDSLPHWFIGSLRYIPIHCLTDLLNHRFIDSLNSYELMGSSIHRFIDFMD